VSDNLVAEAPPYSYPRAATVQSLYEAQKQLVDQLRRTRTQDAAHVGALQDVAEQIGTQIATQIEAGLLTPTQAFDLAISAAAASVFGAAANSSNAAYAELSRIALAQLTVRVQAYATRAALNVEQTVRTTETEALTQQISTFNASLGTQDSRITQEVQARISGDQSLAQTVQTVQTQSSGNTAAISVIQTSANGATVNWGVVANANGQVTGMIALNGSASGTVFTVVADRFVIAHPTVAGQTIQAFVAGLVGGVATVGINGNLLVDGSILARSLQVAALSAITADLGTVTAGLIRNAADTLRFDLPNMRLYRVDGKMDINLNNPRIYMETTT
jgi:hypothetical protein